MRFDTRVWVIGAGTQCCSFDSHVVRQNRPDSCRETRHVLSFNYTPRDPLHSTRLATADTREQVSRAERRVFLF